jgi:hypothetical protein
VKPAQRRFVLHRHGGLGAVPAGKAEQPSIDPLDAIMSGGPRAPQAGLYQAPTKF